MPKPLPFSPIQTILKGLIKDYGMEAHMVEHRLQEGWKGVVGETVALHSRPGRIRFHKLYLFVDSPGWIQELGFLKPALLKKVNGALLRYESEFMIKDIVLKLEGFAGPEEPPKKASRPPAPPF